MGGLGAGASAGEPWWFWLGAAFGVGLAVLLAGRRHVLGTVVFFVPVALVVTWLTLLPAFGSMRVVAPWDVPGSPLPWVPVVVGLILGALGGRWLAVAFHVAVFGEGQERP